MIADVRDFLESGPFEPFVIATSSGSRHRIPGADHATINLRSSGVVVWFDDESGVIISGSRTTSVDKERRNRPGPRNTRPSGLRDVRWLSTAAITDARVSGR